MNCSSLGMVWSIVANPFVGHSTQLDCCRRWFKPSHIPTELEEKTKGKGLIVNWAPQEKGLAHPATGGFLTHGKWNSTLESIYAAAPVICWPVITNQQVNSRCVSEIWRIGFDMKDTCDRSIVEKMVRDLLGDKREEIMKSMDKISKQAQDSVLENGSSYSNLEKFDFTYKIIDQEVMKSMEKACNQCFQFTS
ncbi:hypothetical protein REPUB_Repub02eG0270800 [Reevesia pubescens]